MRSRYIFVSCFFEFFFVIFKFLNLFFFRHTKLAIEEAMAATATGASSVTAAEMASRLPSAHLALRRRVYGLKFLRLRFFSNIF